VVLLPVLVLLLLGVSLVAERIAVQQEALARARDCAHRHSRSGCSELPPGCGAYVATRGATPSRAFEEGAAPMQAAFAALPGALEALSTLPFVGEAVELVLGEQAVGSVELRVAPTALYEAEERVVVGRGHITLPCNEKPTSAGLGDAVWDAITGELF
jgi:hypothetical protein